MFQNYNEMSYQQKLLKQQAFFKSGATKEIAFRKKMLKKLKKLIQQHEDKFYKAIYKDFKKSKFDTYTTEISFLYHDIDYYLKNISNLSQPQKVATNLANQLANSRVCYEPFGQCLVIGAWNYPYQLSLAPAIAAIAAGNTVVLKPSELVPHTSLVMADLINTHFDDNFFCVVEGGVAETTELLKLRFDNIFFTGSSKVGKIVYKAAAEHLTPVTLELGGKSPVIVTKSANLKVAAKRIVWGKFLNAGQTCVAPDYVLVDKLVEQKLLKKIEEYIVKFAYSETSKEFTQIVNERNFDRLLNLIDTSKIYVGGSHNKEERYISPTVLQNVAWSDAVMKEEIFGPILPVLSYNNYNDALKAIQDGEKPLASYLFSSKKKEKEAFAKNISFGGGCVNDVIMHLTNSNLPFGGVGNSGIGNYHGKYGFYTFSHQKAILEKVTWGEPNLKYPPYSEQKLKWIKKIL